MIVVENHETEAVLVKEEEDVFITPFSCFGFWLNPRQLPLFLVSEQNLNAVKLKLRIILAMLYVTSCDCVVVYSESCWNIYQSLFLKLITS